MDAKLSDAEVVLRYVVSYPRLTFALVTFNLVGAVIGCWQYGALAVACAVVIFPVLALALKFVVLLWFHPKRFDFPRRIAPVLIAALPFVLLAAALQLPLYRQICAVDPAALDESHLCAELAP